MNGRLVIFGGDGPADPVRWVSVRASDGVVLAQGDEARIPRAASGVTLILPGSEAIVRALTLPARSLEQARAAAAYHLAPSLALEAAQIFVATSAPNDTGLRLAAAMDRRRLAAWIDRCAKLGVEPDAVHLDCTLAPVSGDTLRRLEIGERTVIAAGWRGGFAIDRVLVEPVLQRWLAELGGDSPEIFVSDATEAKALLMRAAVRPPAFALDLRQGPFAREAGGKSHLPRWRLAAALLMTLAGVQIGLITLEGWRERGAARAALTAAEAEAPSAGITRVSNLRAQTTAGLNAARHPATHPVIASAGPLTDTLTLHPHVRVEEVRYDAPGRRVAVRLSALDPGDLEAAAGQLVAGVPGLSTVHAGAMSAAEGRVSLVLELDVP